MTWYIHDSDQITKRSIHDSWEYRERSCVRAHFAMYFVLENSKRFAAANVQRSNLAYCTVFSLMNALTWAYRFFCGFFFRVARIGNSFDDSTTPRPGTNIQIESIYFDRFHLGYCSTRDRWTHTFIAKERNENDKTKSKKKKKTNKLLDIHCYSIFLLIFNINTI